MSERELREYAAHLAIDPPLGEKLDFWAGRFLAFLMNLHRDSDTAAVDMWKVIPDRWGDRVLDVQARREKLRAILRSVAESSQR